MKALSTERGIINQNVGGLQVSVDQVLLMDVTDSFTAVCNVTEQDKRSQHVNTNPPVS